MKNLSLKTETVRVLSDDQLDSVAGGARHRPHKPVSSALKPTSTVFNTTWMHGPVSSAHKPG